MKVSDTAQRFKFSFVESTVYEAFLYGNACNVYCSSLKGGHWHMALSLAQFANTLRRAIRKDVLVEVLKISVTWNVMKEVVKGAVESCVGGHLLVAAKKSGLLSQVVFYCDGSTASSLVRESVICGILRDFMEEALKWGKLCEVVKGAVEGRVIGDVLREAAVTGEVMSDIVWEAMTEGVLGDVLVEARKSGLLSNVIQHSDWFTFIPLLIEATKCGMLKDVLVKEPNLVFFSHGVHINWSLAKTLDHVLEMAMRQRVMKDVLEGAKDGGVLGDVIERLKEGEMLKFVLEERMESGVLEDVLDGAKEADVLGDVLMEAKKHGLLLQILHHCNWSTIEALVKESIKCCVLGDLLMASKKCGLFSQVFKWSTAKTLVTEAIRVRLLVDVMREAVSCREMKKVIMGAVEGGVLTDVLALAKTSGLFTDVVQHCDWPAAIPLVTEAIRCGMLRDVLMEAKFSKTLSLVLQHCDMFTPESEKAEAIRSDLMRAMLVAALRHRKMPQLVTGAVQGCAFGDILEEAMRCGVLSELLKGAVESGVLRDVLVKAKKSGYLSLFVQHSDWSTFESIATEAIQLGMLKEVLDQAVKCGLMKKVVQKTATGGDMRKTLEEIVIRAELCKLVRSSENLSVVHEEYTRTLGSHLVYAKASGKLKKTLMTLLHLNTPRDVIVEAAKEQGMLGEVLEIVRLLHLFKIFNAVFFLVLLLAVSTSEQSRNTGHCSSDHRKCVIDHVTLRCGDIERNPGPVFFFNDWLKEIFALIVRCVFGYHGKNIRWKEIGISNPNTGLDRSAIITLFRQHSQIVQAADPQIPSTHTEEFQILRTYIRTGQEPDLGHLEKLVEKRKVKVNLQETLKKLQEQSYVDQQEIVSCLDPQLITVLQNAVKTSQRNENEDSSNSDTDDSGVEATAPSSNDESASVSLSSSSVVCEQQIPDNLTSFILENSCHTVPSAIAQSTVTDDTGLEDGEQQEMQEKDDILEPGGQHQVENGCGPSEQRLGASVDDQSFDSDHPRESDENPIPGSSGSLSFLPADNDQRNNKFNHVEDCNRIPCDQQPTASFDCPQSNILDQYGDTQQDAAQEPSGAQSPAPQDSVQRDMTEVDRELWDDISDLAKEGCPKGRTI